MEVTACQYGGEGLAITSWRYGCPVLFGVFHEVGVQGSDGACTTSASRKGVVTVGKSRVPISGGFLAELVVCKWLLSRPACVASQDNVTLHATVVVWW